MTNTPIGYLQLVRTNRNFRCLWSGQIVSLLGDWFNLVASATLVASLTDSGVAVGTLFALRMLAPFLVSPLAGVVADRFNRRSILVTADLARALVVLGFLWVREPGDVWLLYTLATLQLAVSGFFFPARNAILPDLVTDRQLGTANALGSVTWSVMLAFGAATGGIISGLLGVYVAFVIDAVTFLLSALLLLRIRGFSSGHAEGVEKSISAGIRQYIEGLVYLKRHPDVLVITLHKAAVGLLIGTGFDIVMVTISEQVFVVGIGGGIGLGLMYAATGIGTGVGPITARKFTADRQASLRKTLGLAYFLGTAGLLTVAPLFNFQSVLVGLFIRGLGGGTIWVFSTQLLLQLVPAEVRGRVFATELALFTLMAAVGSAFSGALLDSAMGISGVTLLFASLTVVFPSFWIYWNRKADAAGAGGQGLPDEEKS